MSRFKDLINKIESQEQPTAADENEYKEWEPRNVLADTINPHLENVGLQGLEKVSAADRKRFMNETMSPENVALGMGMGGIANTNRFQELAKSFGGKKLEVPALDEALSKRISDAFDNMKHDPKNPEVKSAYDALIKEVTEQYDHLVGSGVKAKKIKGENPYKNSSELIDKVKKTDEISYFPTDEGFGSGSVTNNPMLQKTGRVNAEGEEMLANDLFRTVHDVYGHVKPGSSFGKAGEEIAYQNHKQMFSPLAQKALATETRGQNSFVNFGPNAAHNKANPANTIFAEQKVGLLPDWAVNENSAKTVNEAMPGSVYTGIGNAANGQLEKLKALLERKDDE